MLNKQRKIVVLTESQLRSILVEMTLPDIYNKYYSDINRDIFDNIISADPSSKPNKMGKYCKWLLNLYKNNRLKIEDLYKATEYLTFFSKYINKIEEKDINRYNSLGDLYNAVQPYISASESGKDLATSHSDEIRRIKSDATKIYEDDEWLVVVPHTKEAAIYYGKHTQWCTAAEDSYNAFDEYNKEGPLFININKKTNKKYQFHFNSHQFMDENDCSIRTPINKTIHLNNNVIQMYASQIGDTSVIYLTQDVKFDNYDEFQPVVGGDSIYIYWSDNEEDKLNVVQVNNTIVKPFQINGFSQFDQLQEPEYYGNGIFGFYELGYFDDGSYYCSTDKTFYNVKNGKSITGEFTSTYPINQKYYLCRDKNHKNTVLTKDLVEKNVPDCHTIYSANTYASQWHFSGEIHNYHPYNEDLIVLSSYTKDKYGTKSLLYNLDTEQIIPSPFHHPLIKPYVDKESEEWLCYYEHGTDNVALIDTNGKISRVFKKGTV